MIDRSNFKYMTKEQQRHCSMLGVQARELLRHEQSPEGTLPIPRGLQLACMVMDLRYGFAQYHHGLLFQVGDNHRSYKWILDNEKQNGLIGWTEASREVAGLVRPVARGLF